MMHSETYEQNINLAFDAHALGVHPVMDIDHAPRGPKGKYQVVVMYKRWLKMLPPRIIILDDTYAWQQACRKAEEMVTTKGVIKTLVVCKMRRYTNPSAIV